MYSREGDIDIARIEDDARAYLLHNDRFKYLPVLAAIERFASSHAMIIGGRIGVITLSAQRDGSQIDTIDADLWMLELFSSNIHEDMVKCMETVTREVSENDIYVGDPRTIMINPVIHEREYRLVADFRIVAIGRSLGMRVGVNITKLVIDASGEGRGLFSEMEKRVRIVSTDARSALYRTKSDARSALYRRANIIMTQSMASSTQSADADYVPIRVMPRTLQIMRLAHMLCNPDLASKWSSYVEQIGDLFVNVATEIGIEHSGGSIVGARDDALTMLRERYGALIIGEHAVSYYVGDQRVASRAREQYIMTFDNIEELCANAHLTHARIDVRVPDDFRARKIILRHGDDVVADVFNTVDYEPVPVVTDGARYASPWCVIRFLFIDIWSLDAIIEGMRATDSTGGARESLRARQRYLGALARKLFDWMCVEQLGKIFPRTFEGFAVPESAAKGRANKGMRLMSESAQSAETLGTLREELAKKIMA